MLMTKSTADGKGAVNGWQFSFIILVSFFYVGVFYDINRTVFRLKISLCKILSDDSEAK